MKKVFCFLLAVVILSCSVYAAPSASFSDVDDSAWYAPAVQFVEENHVMQGIGNHLFAPENEVTRAMIATVLWRLEGEPVCNRDELYKGNDFTDVSEDSWYYNSCEWMFFNELLLGACVPPVDNTPGGIVLYRLMPEERATREQIAVLLFRYAGFKGYDVEGREELTGFSDADKVSSYAIDAIKWSVAEGIMNGMDGNLNPQSEATRAQVATMLMRFSALNQSYK